MEISLKNVTKKYDERTVLDILDLSIDCSGITAIIGPNGSGKTTMASIIAGLTGATSGEIFYDGKDKIPSKEITLVFQKPYLISSSVEMNINYPMKLRGWDPSDIRKRTDELLNELGLSELRTQKTWKLSGGESQKVALARALSFNPRLLILDEPTANVDPATTAEIERILKKTASENGTNIILVTHNLAQAKRVSDKTIFMNKGMIVEQGRTENILKDPTHEDTKTFIKGELLI